MRKNALIICSFVAALGVFGAFFRWLQNSISFDAETGLMKPGLLNVLVPAAIIIAAGLFYYLIVRLRKTYAALSDMYSVFRGTSIFYPIFAWTIAVIVILGGFILMINSAESALHGMYFVIAVLAVFTGICFPMICTAARSRYSPAMVSLFTTLPIVLFALWLITCYKANASNPNTWVYAIEIIACCIVTAAFYFIAGYPYGRAKPYYALFFAMLGAYLCIMTLADSRYVGQQFIFLGTAGMLLMECWMITNNMVEKTDAPEEELPEPEETEELPEEEPEEAEEVLPVKDEMTGHEPTIQAPATRSAPASERLKSLQEIDEIIKEYKNLNS